MRTVSICFDIFFDLDAALVFWAGECAGFRGVCLGFFSDLDAVLVFLAGECAVPATLGGRAVGAFFWFVFFVVGFIFLPAVVFTAFLRFGELSRDFLALGINMGGKFSGL